MHSHISYAGCNLAVDTILPKVDILLVVVSVTRYTLFQGYSDEHNKNIL